MLGHSLIAQVQVPHDPFEPPVKTFVKPSQAPID
jgi:hypothetical protein